MKNMTSQINRDPWRSVPLGDVTLEAKAGFACGERIDTGIVQLRMNNITSRGDIDLSNLIRIPVQLGGKSEYILKPGDILFNNTNSAEQVGKTGLFQNYEEPVLYSNHFTRLRVDTERAEPAFVSRYIHSLFLAGVLEKLCDRWIGQAAIQRNKLLRIQVPLPPLPEQKRIVAILNEQMAAVEKARAAAEAQLEAAKALSAAYLREVFPKGEPGKVPLPDGWRWERLGAVIAETRNGLYKPDEYYGSGTPILKMFNIGRLDGSWNLERVDQIRLTDEDIETYSLQLGDILLNRVNSRELVGKSAVADEATTGAVFESKNVRLRLTPNEANSIFVSTYLNSVAGRRQFLERLKQIVGQATVNRSDLDSILIPLPPLFEQKRIVAILNDRMKVASELKESVESQLSSINAIPAALLRQAFSGAL